ncbi:MAG: ATP-binding cassette domain-containing protein [Spirochaetales bacterium]|nr:ATP-binding cassette domain-containing protein [Spirochaetales bacterium]
MIRIVDLHKSFEGNLVLDGVSIDIPDSDSLVIVGKSGIGKSVLLKCVTRLLVPDCGRVYIDDEDITVAGRDDLLRIRRKIGLLLQEGALFDSLDVYENVAFPLWYHRLFTRGEIDRKVRHYLDIVEMPEFIHAFPDELSGGMKRKVALARAMILEPKYLLYDEPTTGLDPMSAGIVESMMMKLKREMNITSLIVTHDPDLAHYIGERIALLDGGKLVAVETRDGAFEEQSPIYEYFIHTRERVHNNHGSH